MKPTPTYDSAAQLPEHRMITESPHENEHTARRQGRHVFAFALALVTPPAMRCATAGAPCNNDGAASGSGGVVQKNDGTAQRQERRTAARASRKKRWRRAAAGTSRNHRSPICPTTNRLQEFGAVIRSM